MEIYCITASVFGTFVPAYLFAIALSKIDGSVSAILNSLTPLNTLLVGLFFLVRCSTWRQIFGVIIGFIGCVLLVLFGDGGATTENYYYAILIVIASNLLWN